MDRREFAGLVPALLAIAGTLTGSAEGQVAGQAGPAAGGGAPRVHCQS